MPSDAFAKIKSEIESKLPILNQVHDTRLRMRGRALTAPALPRPGLLASVLSLIEPVSEPRQFKLVAQGDSWFDYPVGTDLIYCLQHYHGHTIDNIAVYGSTLNDEAYGPVPRAFFGTKQYSDISRIAELVHLIQRDRPHALLISAGGNDITNDKLFTLLNNAEASPLPSLNPDVLQGMVNGTFRDALKYMIDMALEAAAGTVPGGPPPVEMAVFLHGYDYPWPDGRALVHFLGVDIGPWLDPPLTAKNYPVSDMDKRRAIMKQFIDSLNAMQDSLEADYPGKVFHVNLTGTLHKQEDWANELHPGDDGFAALAARFDAVLQAKIP